MNDEKAKNPAITDQALAEAYEALIDEGLSSNVPANGTDPGHVAPRLTERRVYLRESDKRLSGTITYQMKEKGAADYDTEKTANFLMDAAGDFSRNHTWIVYAYYAGSGNLQVQSLYVKDWSTKEFNHELYNW